MSDKWFFHPETVSAGDLADLEPEEARHALGSRRLREGDEITLFDGRGTTAAARVRQMDRCGGRVEVLATTVQPPDSIEVEIITALPKGDRIAVMITMAVQLGISGLRPLLAERSIVAPRPEVPDRWRRIAIEACKQARRARLPRFGPPLNVEELARADPADTGDLHLLADGEGRPLLEVPVQSDDPLRSVRWIVGPEGGLTEAERARLIDAGWRPIRLGRFILRVETAVVAALAASSVISGRSTVHSSESSTNSA